MEMTSRQRVRTALSHKEPDRVPVDFGATRSTGINALAYSALRKHLGMGADPVRVYDLKQLLALPDADMLALFHSDCVQLHRMAPSAGLDIRAWKPERLMDGVLYLVPENYHPVRIVDTTGAGDTFSAALAVALCEGQTLTQAAVFAVRAAAQTVTKMGVVEALPYRKDLA